MDVTMWLRVYCILNPLI